MRYCNIIINIELCGYFINLFYFSLSALLISVKNGEFRKYEGQRSLQGFTEFITEQKWTEVEPIPWWKSPSSFMYV